jgi:hypothetical protein
MKGGSGTVLLGFVLALILVVKGLAAGSLLEPTSIDPSPPTSGLALSLGCGAI